MVRILLCVCVILLIMDIVVQLGDGSIVNLEVQKIGYRFPGERSACYSADLLLRQYKRVRSEKKRKKHNFSYKDIKGVYTIVFFEKSPGEFHAFSDEYLHYFYQCSNTGLKLNLLQKYLFIPLDIFKEKQHNNNNKTTKNKLEAWLTFLCVDDPETIIELIDTYPEFKPMYEEAYGLCRNIEGVMQMFSKELAELDRNTVQLMIDEMQDEIHRQKRQLEQAAEEKRGIIRRIYQFGQTSEEIAQMLDISLEEVKQAIEG